MPPIRCFDYLAKAITEVKSKVQLEMTELDQAALGLDGQISLLAVT